MNQALAFATPGHVPNQSSNQASSLPAQEHSQPVRKTKARSISGSHGGSFPLQGIGGDQKTAPASTSSNVEDLHKVQQSGLCSEVFGDAVSSSGEYRPVAMDCIRTSSCTYGRVLVKRSFGHPCHWLSTYGKFRYPVNHAVTAGQGGEHKRQTRHKVS